MRLPFHIDPVGRLLNDIGLAGPIVASAILAGDALLTSVLHRDLKRSLRLSAALAWLYLVISAVRCLAPIQSADNEIERVFRVIAAVALSLALAQTLFVLLVDFALGRNGKKPLRPMIRYGLLGVTFLVAALAGLRAGGVATVGVLAGGAVVIGGLGAAVAEVLRQVGAGVLVQYARPFEEGDVVKLVNHTRRGMVLGTNWRTTTLRSVDGLEHMVPNSEFVTQTVTNFGHGDRVFRREIEFDAMYEAPPERVRQAVISAMRDVPGVEPTPPATVILSAFKDSGVGYQLRYWTRRAVDYEVVDADVRARVWYAFARAGLGFPFPTRTLHLAREGDDRDGHRTVAARLQRASLFASLSEEAVLDIALHGREEPYGAAEVIVKAGEQGRSMHVILEGVVAVLADDGATVRRELFRLQAGDFFGEMSLITGAPRTATVVTVGATRTFVIDEPSFRAMITRHPDVAEALSEVLAQRQAELAEKLEERTIDDAQRRATKSVMLARLKGLFGLTDK
ncbi:MAG: mechanosensitive ion channel family protein [Deltaproteobacteria bacterium]|nr:mechanosensitive ion channel family protein [Deltaproteobacteria bacterium]